MMSLAEQIDLIAEHIGDDQPHLPEGAKNSLLLAAKALRESDRMIDRHKMSDLEQRLRDAAQAYPEDVFPPVTDEDRDKCGFAVTRASAAMGRHFSPMLTEAADYLAYLESALSDTNAVHRILKDAGRDPLSISVELGVTISEAANPTPPKKKAKP